MPFHDDFGARMKRYEEAHRTRLLPQLPVLLRLDGRAFHTFTAGLQRPFDQRFASSMLQASLALCRNIPGARLAYTQSDEITLLLYSPSRYFEPWFDLDVQKLCSVSAGLCSVAFYSAWTRAFPDSASLPHFDARCWNLPVHEVANAFIWRQADAVRNSINALAQAHFPAKELHGLKLSAVQERLWAECSINWSQCDATQKRGAIVTRQANAWVCEPAPEFAQNRHAIEDLLAVEPS